MNDSAALDGEDSLSLETFCLGSISQRWDAGISARVFTRNNTALGVLLGGLCFGVLELLLFVFAVFSKKVATRHLTVFKVSLVFTGLLQSLSTPAVVMELVGSPCSLRYCYKLLVVWSVSRRCGVLLHLLVALEFILVWKQPRDLTRILPLYWSLPVVLTLVLICILFFEVIEAAVAFGAVAMTLTVVIFIQACCYPSHVEKRLAQVLWSALLSFGGTYFPSFAIECMIMNNEPISTFVYDIVLCLTNLRLVTDGYLYLLTCKETPEEAPQQMEAGQVSLESIRQV